MLSHQMGRSIRDGDFMRRIDKGGAVRCEDVLTRSCLPERFRDFSSVCVRGGWGFAEKN